MQEKEKRILESAIKHFIRYGYRKTSIDEIVKDARVGKGMVYHYFTNKEDLFKKVAEIEHEIMFNELEKAVASEQNAEKRLVLYVFKKIQYTRDFFLERGSDPGILKELKDSYERMVPDYLREVAIIAEIIEIGIDNHVFKIDAVQQTASLISTIIRQFEIRWNELQQKEAETEVAALFDIIFKGLRA
jgi:AcrR family transcriptional regulator